MGVSQFSLGKKIRELRRARGVTQEQLADALGISFQSVSKWETGIALPDVAMTPAIARYFGVTMDVLFDFDLRAQEEKARAILEDGLRQYPDDPVLLNNLLYTYDCNTDPDAVIALASRLVGDAEQPDVRYDAVRCLAEAYKAKGDERAALSALEQIPEIYFSRLSVLASIASGEEKRAAANKEKWISFETTLRMMAILAEYYEETGDIARARRETDAAERMLLALSEDPVIGAFDRYLEGIRDSQERLAALEE